VGIIIFILNVYRKKAIPRKKIWIDINVLLQPKVPIISIVVKTSKLSAYNIYHKVKFSTISCCVNFLFRTVYCLIVMCKW